MMLPVQKHLIIDCFLIFKQLFWSVTVVPAILRDAEVLKICDFIALFQCKIRRIWLVGIENIILIWLFIAIIDIVQIQEVGDGHLLC